jgi:serine/threonine-protein kinase HipA
MTSERAYAWIWLPGSTQPVACGILERYGNRIHFAYGRHYLARDDAVALYGIPLQPGRQIPDDEIHLAFLDSAPDSWGRRLINYRLRHESTWPDVLTYLTEGGSDRVGALDFQASPEQYVARETQATLEEMMEAADRVAAGEPIPPQMEAALFHGTSVGGARPKAALWEGDRALIAKFEMRTDLHPEVNAEAFALTLASWAGIRVPASEVRHVAGKDVLLVERFDRLPDGQRRLLVSAYTLLGGGRASYVALADVLRASGGEDDSRELFARLTFNIIAGNIDDHSRNHACFWDGKNFELTPAYDIVPQHPYPAAAQQAMDISRDGRRRANLACCVSAADEYGLSKNEARYIIDRQIDTVHTKWEEAAEQSRLSREQAELLMERQILNPGALDGYAAA